MTLIETVLSMRRRRRMRRRKPTTELQTMATMAPADRPVLSSDSMMIDGIQKEAQMRVCVSVCVTVNPVL